jgi:hypothetical protein
MSNKVVRNGEGYVLDLSMRRKQVGVSVEGDGRENNTVI